MYAGSLPTCALEINSAFFGPEVVWLAARLETQLEIRLGTAFCRIADRGRRPNAISLTTPGEYALEERDLKAWERYRVHRPPARLLH
jgi:hypothetical protein